MTFRFYSILHGKAQGENMTRNDKVGLVLEGGAMRGLFSAGVLDVLMENDLYPDGLIGVSAGAVFGCNLKSRQKGRVLRYNLRFCRDPRYCSWRSLLFTGDLFGKEFCYHTLPNELDPFDKETFDSSPLEFYLVCTDVETGDPVYRKCTKADEECYEWMRASSSMPLVSRPVPIGGAKYLDGAISDAIPLKFFREKCFYSRNIVILTQPASYRKRPQKGMRLLSLLLRNYPKIVEKLRTRHLAYNEAVSCAEELARKGSVLLIRPESTLPAGRLCREPELLQKTYDLGRLQGEKFLPQIRTFLGK